MSGIEVAGLVLGALPIVIKCLVDYEENFKIVEDWRNFRLEFVAFVDSIRHELMRFHDSLKKLLRPAVKNPRDLEILLSDEKSELWKDEKLRAALKGKLGSEFDRLLRLIGDINRVVEKLTRLLKINDGEIEWLEKPWYWHYQRLRFSVSNSKDTQLRRLGRRNDELEKMISRSDTVILVSSGEEKASVPTEHFDQIRNHASELYQSLQTHWNCEGRCSKHGAHLGIDIDTTCLYLQLVFVFGEGEKGSLRPRVKELIVLPSNSTATNSAPPMVNKAELFTKAQQSIMGQQPHRGLRIGRVWNSKPETGQYRADMSPPCSSNSESQTYSSTTRTKTITQSHQIPSVLVTATQKVEDFNEMSMLRSSQSIGLKSSSGSHSTEAKDIKASELCVFLGDASCWSARMEIESGGSYIFRKDAKHFVSATTPTMGLVSLSELLDRHDKKVINLTRECRLKMAAHIASALLQTHSTPWLRPDWSGDDFLFAFNTEQQQVCSHHPYVSRDFQAIEHDTSVESSPWTSRTTRQNETRSRLFRVGVIVLELIFGSPLKKCKFYPTDRTNDQTELCTALKWAECVKGESGPKVAEAVRRCLCCAFGPAPCLEDVNFREAVYDEVVKPLASYGKLWDD